VSASQHRTAVTSSNSAVKKYATITTTTRLEETEYEKLSSAARFPKRKIVPHFRAEKI